MGVTFTHYLYQVRMMHIYQEICKTQTGIKELAEKHGFSFMRYMGVRCGKCGENR